MISQSGGVAVYFLFRSTFASFPCDGWVIEGRELP